MKFSQTQNIKTNVYKLQFIFDLNCNLKGVTFQFAVELFLLLKQQSC